MVCYVFYIAFPLFKGFKLAVFIYQTCSHIILHTMYLEGREYFIVVLQLVQKSFHAWRSLLGCYYSGYSSLIEDTQHFLECVTLYFIFYIHAVVDGA